MTSEKDILTNMDKMVTSYLTSLQKIKVAWDIIQSQVDQLDNNYFLNDKDNLYQELLYNFDNDEINNVTKLLTIYKEIIKDKLENSCDHEWINDYIDIGPDCSQIICYCSKCEVTKK
jgi:hypothetical protein